MGRRRGTRDRQRREIAAAEAAELRRTARGWFIRALLGLVAAGLVSFLSILVALVLLLAVGYAVWKGLTVAVAAQRLVEDGTG